MTHTELRKKWKIFNATAPTPGLKAHYSDSAPRPVVSLLIMQVSDHEVMGPLGVPNWTGEGTSETAVVPGVFDAEYNIIPAGNAGDLVEVTVNGR